MSAREPQARALVAAPAQPCVERRICGIDWPKVFDDLDAEGNALVPQLLAQGECEALAALYEDDLRFRTRVLMQRHGFGRGEYKYFAHPLPELVRQLREGLYARLVPLANRWHGAMGMPASFPDTHAQFIARCHEAGQTRPTPLLLRYGEGDFNCLHQDLYGEQIFPLQLVVLLSEPQRDFTGGEFVMTEQRPRMQSKARVVPLRQGDAVVIAVHRRPVQGARGVTRVNMRHGVSSVRTGLRHTAGIVFHDAA